MKIKVESDTIWTINDLKEYLSDMHNDKYQEMDYDQRLALAACAYIYCRYPEIAPEQISYLAKEDISEGIDELFFVEMYDRLIRAYNSEIIDEYVNQGDFAYKS